MDEPMESTASGLADLPIDVAEAMYSPDFIELVTLAGGGLPVVLPMSFTLDVPDNRVRLSSPVGAARLAHLARDPRCAVSFSRVTAGYPPVLLQGVATLGDVAEGVRRGPARRFTVSPRRVVILGESPHAWHMPDGVTDTEPASAARPVEVHSTRRPSTATPVTPEDLAAVAGFETTAVGLRDADGWPISLPVEVDPDEDGLIARLPAGERFDLQSGPASLLGHTWTRDGPRYLALTGDATIDGAVVRFTPRRALRRA
jgi:hypothetical protein